MEGMPSPGARKPKIHLTVLLKDQVDPFEEEVDGWDIHETGALVVYSEGHDKVRALAPGSWAEVVGVRENHDYEDVQ